MLTRDRLTIPALFAAFAFTVLAANWSLDRWGLVSVGFGLTAPAGVYFAGLAFGLRDALHEAGGRTWVVAGILTGAAVSLLIEDAISIPGGHAPIAIASATAFLLGELADLAVYEPLRERHWTAAVIASNLAGAVIDSALFLWLAFGSTTHITGQLVGKAYMIAPAVLIVGLLRAARTYVDDQGRRYRPAIDVYLRDDGTRGAYIEGRSPASDGWFCMEPATDAEAAASLRELGFSRRQIARAPGA